MVAIQKKLTPYNFTKMKDKRNEYIVIHYVGALGTAKQNAEYYAREHLQSSASYFVDTGSIWQSVADSNRAWHCGTTKTSGGAFFGKCTNSNSIGIEMCCKKDSRGVWYFESATVSNTIDLVRCLMKKYNIPIERVIRHYDVTLKNCPAPYVRNAAAWAEFKDRIEEDKPMTKSESKAFDALIARVEKLEKNKNPTYATLLAVPTWGREVVERLTNRGILKGDSNGHLNITYDMLRLLVVLDRAGALK